MSNVRPFPDFGRRTLHLRPPWNRPTRPTRPILISELTVCLSPHKPLSLNVILSERLPPADLGRDGPVTHCRGKGKVSDLNRFDSLCGLGMLCAPDRENQE